MMTGGMKKTLIYAEVKIPSDSLNGSQAMGTLAV